MYLFNFMENHTVHKLIINVQLLMLTKGEDLAKRIYKI